ncbi:MAG: selenocysteine-specific translation elongation factor [Pseudomonadales bacterium]
MIVTLAGHVDHGKTSLVRVLTGVNTDSLAEEQARGLTIDLGFAYLKDGERRLGFVDVPGHHRFIHNMVAGVSADQHALLVVAADDGPMPQSREHLQILELIGVRSGTVALTKCDRVSSERRAAALDEVQRLIEGSCLAGSPVIETSTATGEGVDALRERLLAVNAQHAAAGDGGVFRMPIDRAFTISGAGAVVTGTIHSGNVRVDDTLTLLPAMKTVRVKGVRAQDETVAEACTGERTALNLSGVEVDELGRGQWLAGSTDPGSDSFTVMLSVLDDFPRAVRHWLPVHVYHATTHTTAHIALLTSDRVQPGMSALVELETDTPLLVRRDDRLVIRDQGLDRTLGGARVVSIRPAGGRRRAGVRVGRLAADAMPDPRASLEAHLAMGPVTLAVFRDNWGLDAAAMDALLADVEAIAVNGEAIARATWSGWRDEVLAFIEARHREDSSLQGLKQSEIDSPAGPLLPVVLAELVAAGKLVSESGRFRPAAHQVVLADAERQWLDRVAPLLDQPQPPSLGDMAKRFRLGPGDLAKRLHPLVTKKQLVRISDSRYYLPAHLATLAAVARTLDADGPFTVRQYRDASGIGRNVAIEVLEHFDRTGFTRRDGDLRKIVGEYPTS